MGGAWGGAVDENDAVLSLTRFSLAVNNSALPVKGTCVNKLIFKIMLTAGFLCPLFSTALYAEFVFLKDGAIIEGTITGDASDSITIYTKDKQVKTVYRSQIMRILYTEFKMSRVYIQKRDGQGFAAYMVDEDRTSYTFRKELYKPEEFSIKREEVLFMAEKNPSGLKGEAGTTSVELTWLPPYDAVKKYNIYVTQKKGAGYMLAQSSGGKSATVKNLNSNTTYYFIVKSVDADGYESGPSNELSVTTKNILPDAPSGISIDIKYSPDRSTFTAVIKWNAASDPDGKVKGYNVYRHDTGEAVPGGKTAGTEFAVKDLSSKEFYLFSVKSVDDKNEESEDAAIITTTHPDYSIGLQLNYLVPLGDTGDILSGGYGLLISAYKEDFIFNDLDAGFTSGFWFFNGNGDTVDSSFMVPLMASVRYNIPVTWHLYITPSIHAGYWYNSIDYNKLNQATLQTELVTEDAFEPAVYADLTANYRINERIIASAGIGYGTIFETDGMVQMLSVNAGLELMFY